MTNNIAAMISHDWLRDVSFRDQPNSECIYEDVEHSLFERVVRWIQCKASPKKEYIWVLPRVAGLSGSKAKTVLWQNMSQRRGACYSKGYSEMKELVLGDDN